MIPATAAMRVIPVDDESLLRQHRCDGLERYPEIVVVGEADKVQSAAALVAMTWSKDLGFFICEHREPGYMPG
jgi:hypothetical protein